MNIGAIPVISQYKITSLIDSFRSEYPHINMNFVEGERDDVIDMLINFAFLRDFNLSEELFHIHHLIKFL